MSVPSETCSQPRASLALVANCSMRRWVARPFSAVATSAGPSDGLVRRFPEAIWFCWRVSAEKARARSAVMRALEAPVAMRVLMAAPPHDGRAGSSSAHRPGAVDQGVEHLVDGGDDPGGGGVRLLGGHQVHHLLVQVHARHGPAVLVEAL